MLNILVALRLRAKDWSGLSIKIHCDNQAVVTILNSDKTRDSNLASISRNIFMLCAEFDIFLIVEHVAGKDNELAHLLSRWSDSKSDNDRLQNLLPRHKWLKIQNRHFWVDSSI